jgi:hypothetical protein
LTKCTIHTNFFSDVCMECKKEYYEMKSAQIIPNSDAQNNQSTHKNGNTNKKYKEFTEERAKKLYEELMLQYIKVLHDESEAAEKARGIIRKQCSIRGIPFWPWANS